MNRIIYGDVDVPFAGALDELRQNDLYRRCRAVRGAQGAEVIIDGRCVVSMCSNNYLGLADHPDLIRAAAKAAVDFGVGAGSSRLVSGTMEPHCELEKKLAQFKGAQECLLFNSGYQANVGVLSSIARKDDVIYSDELNHASIIDGTRLSKADVEVYQHLNTSVLEKMMERREDVGRKIIVTDSVFSMDGDTAPMSDLVELKKRHGAILIIDEAHATGVVGPGGAGLAASMGLENDVDMIVGTLGKALGGFGAFVTGRSGMIDWLTNTARSFIYTTALPPTVAATSLAALELIEREPERVENLKRNAAYFSGALGDAGVDVNHTEIPIIPLVIGEADEALDVANRLFEEGIFCGAIRPPSVPVGSSRLRLTIMATHTREQLDRAVEAISKILRQKGLIV